MGRRFWRRKWILRKYYFQLVKDGVSKIYTYTALFTRGPECYVLMMNNLYYLSNTNGRGGITPPYRHYWSIIKFGYFDVFFGKLNHKEQFYAAKSLPDYEYLESADKFVKSNGERQGVFTDNLLKKLADIFADGAYLSEKEGELDEALQQSGATFLGREDILNTLRSHKYHIYGDFISKGKVSYGELAAKVINEYFPDGVSVCSDDNVPPKEDFLKVRKLVEEKYQIKIDASNRSFSVRMIDHTVQCGRGKVIAKERVKFDYLLMTKIRDYICKNPDQQIYFTSLFNKFEDELNTKTNITTPELLHGVIRWLFPKDFSFDRDTVCRKQTGYTELLSDRIVDCIRKANRPMTRAELQGMLPEMTPIMLSVRINHSNDIVTWGFDKYYLRELVNISNDEVNMISDIITEIQNQNNGYCSGGMLYEKLIEKMPQVLSRNNVDSRLKTYSLAAAFLSDKFDCSSPHILRKGCFAKISTMGIVKQLLGNRDTFTYNEVIETIAGFKWPSPTIGCLITKLEEDNVLIAEGKYVNKAKLNLENDIDVIEAEIKKHEKRGIVTISDSMNYANLPDIGYAWNGYLLKSVIENFGKKYKVIHVQYRDRRYIQFFIVRKESEFITFDQVVANFMIEDGSLTVSEGKMLKLLQGAGLHLKSVPVELKTSEYIKYDSDKGTFAVKD